MPEIKNTFSQGKMNKDLDVRLVPKGQYRDAMNIQVSTSEGSDVGTVQNLLGNFQLPSSVVSPSSKCIGAISNEKENCFYWFVWNTYSDVILKYQNGNVSIVVLDFKGSNNPTPTLKFDNDSIITGINIIDNFLFWTDNINEPRKINLTLCEAGTDQIGSHQTRLVVPEKNETNFLDSYVPLEEQHITVIKKAPNSKLTLIPKFVEVVAGQINTNAANPFAYNGVLKENGDTVQIGLVGHSGQGFEEGDIVIAAERDANSLPDDYQVRFKITEDLSGNEITISMPYPLSDILFTLPAFTYQVEVLSISSSLSTNRGIILDCQTVFEGEVLFEDKIPRFSYRWRYRDGEYSTFAPFTDVLFEPSEFKYNAKEGYNSAMENSLTSLELRNFKQGMPYDVVQIDILYKESGSPTVYIVDTLKYKDSHTVAEGGIGLFSNNNILTNHFRSDQYKINSDTIFSTVPENQLLRPWDNVPRQAKSQEIVGNRIVYGNYLQNYNLDEKPFIISNYIARYNLPHGANGKYRYTYSRNKTRNPVPHLETFKELYGEKSLKSMRDYQVGVTYLDKYGRETPVFSNTKSTFHIPKSQSSTKTAISTIIKTNAPAWADYFKLYVKEISNKYYNLAMDRIYKASDGNFWISFPSSERNKIDEETYLELKKGTDVDSALTESAKYKILAISNEAPEFVKTSIKQVGSVPSSTIKELFKNNKPIINQAWFEVDYNLWVDSGNPNLSSITDTLTLEFSAGNTFSKRYEVVIVEKLVGVAEDGGDVLRINLNRPLSNDDKFIYPNYPTVEVNNLPDFNSLLQFKVFKAVVKQKPEFDGKFFVKINGSSVIDTYLLSNTSNIEWEILAQMDAFLVQDQRPAYDSSGIYIGGQYTGGHQAHNWRNSNIDRKAYAADGNSSLGHSNDYFETNQFFENRNTWINTTNNILDFDSPQDGETDREWFIDRAWFAGMWPTVVTNDTLQDAQSLFKTGPRDERYGQSGFGRGIFEYNGKVYMEVSYSKVGENLFEEDEKFTDQTSDDVTPKFYKDDLIDKILNDDYWKLGSPSNPVDRDQDAIVSQLVMGSKFKLAGDVNGPNGEGVIYTINGPVRQKRRFNFINWRSATNLWYEWGPRKRSDGVVDYDSADTDQENYYPDEAGMSNDNSDAPDDPWEIDDWEDQQYVDWRVHNLDFGRAENRRVTFVIPLDKNPNTESSFAPQAFNSNAFRGQAGGGVVSTSADIDRSVGFQFVKQRVVEEDVLISNNPAIWETIPKKAADIDIYYEASPSYALKINSKTNYIHAPLGSVVICPSHPLVIQQTSDNPCRIVRWLGPQTMLLSHAASVTLSNAALAAGEKPYLRILRPNGGWTTLLPKTQGLVGKTFQVEEDVSKNPVSTSYFNCFQFGNGVESTTIRDDFNASTLDKGAKASSTIDTEYEQERRKSGLIYSGIYNSNSGVNNLNQFIQAEKITKDLNPSYGSIQKLYARNSDLVAFCEDKVIRILANKDALFNADGNPQLIATNRVLGQAIPFSGDYGISKNPESFASENYRAYFTDKQRGVVLRLSKDGLTPISDYGMSDYFKDNLLNNTKLIGSYDDRKKEYNISLVESEKTVSFDEAVNGWVSFKSFIPEFGISLSNNYFTFKRGLAYQHHVEKDVFGNPDVERNTFYGIYTPSSITAVLNDQPSSIKQFLTLNYEGSQSYVVQERIATPFQDDGASEGGSGYYNLNEEKGWKVEIIKTGGTGQGYGDNQTGFIDEFIKKEGKWFNYIKSADVSETLNVSTNEFSFQGIGSTTDQTLDMSLYTDQQLSTAIYGCTDSNAYNYNAQATINDGSCYLPYTPIYGCMDNTTVDGSGPGSNGAMNYDPLATIDDGGCIYFARVGGCTDSNTDPTYSMVPSNFNPAATFDDGSCIYEGCTDPRASNYNPQANVDDNSCYMAPPPPTILGCTNPGADNYNPLANSDDGSCTFTTSTEIPDTEFDPLTGLPYYTVPGCTDPNAFNYDPLATIDDGSCLPFIYGCMNPLALNYDSLANTDDGSCYFAQGEVHDSNDND